MKNGFIPTMAIALALGILVVPAAQAGPEGKCKACHSFNKGEKHRTGPNLFGIMGRKAGSTDYGKYGSYLKDADFTWNPCNMRAWIKDSKAVAKAAGKKTTMPKQRVKGAKADAIIEFLSGLK